MSYQVQLDVFQGPFDLLLHLISRRQVEVTEIDLADITADYVRSLRDGLETLDLESATRFLMVAATLLVISHVRANRGKTLPTVLSAVIAVFVVVAAIATSVQVYRIGHSGAESVWGDALTTSTAGVSEGE